MRLSYIAPALLSYTVLVVAQDQSVTVQIGGQTDTPGGSLQFIPNSINATTGSVITFVWSGHPGNHSLTQSSFAEPCNPVAGGFDSGWISVPADDTDSFPSFNLTITNDTAPVWFYCKQLAASPHCKAGMVGAINAPGQGDKTFAAFQDAAKNFDGTPGQGGDGALVGVGASASAPPAPLTGEVSGVGVPTITSGGDSSGSDSTATASASDTTTTSGGVSLAWNALAVVFAAVLGINLA